MLVIILDNEEDRVKAVEIYNKFYSTMMYTAIQILKDHALAEDAVADSMIKVLQNLNRVQDIGCYKTRHYIVTIVRNTAINIWNKRNRHDEETLDKIENVTDGEIPILEQLTSAEGVVAITKAMRSLPKTLSDALLLSAAHGFLDLEIASELGISYDAARMRLSRARKELRIILEDEQHEK